MTRAQFVQWSIASIVLYALPTQLVAQPVASTGRQNVVPVIGFASLSADGKIELENNHGALAVPKIEKVEQAYTVMVPVEAEEEVDGKKTKVVKYVPQQQTRTTSVVRMKTVEKAQFPLDDCKFMSVGGEELSTMEIEEDFRNRRPVLILFQGQSIDETFKAMLKPETILVTCPMAPNNAFREWQPAADIPATPTVPARIRPKEDKK